MTVHTKCFFVVGCLKSWIADNCGHERCLEFFSREMGHTVAGKSTPLPETRIVHILGAHLKSSSHEGEGDADPEE